MIRDTPVESTVPVEPVRVPLAPIDSKANIVAAAATSTASLLAPSRTGSMPMPSRSKSHQNEDNAAIAGTAANIPSKPTLLPDRARSVDDAKIRVHTGLVDQSALSSKPPAEVIGEVLRVLQAMGIEVKKENEFRLRCTRVRRRKAGATTGLGLGTVMSSGSVTGPFGLTNSASLSKVLSFL